MKRTTNRTSGRKIGRCSLTLLAGWMLAAGCPAPKPPSPAPGVAETPAAPVSPAPAPASARRPPMVATYDWTVLSPTERVEPGRAPTPFLLYSNTAARSVSVEGTWNRWRPVDAMSLSNGLWVLDVRSRAIPQGGHEFRFAPDGKPETGKARVLNINEYGWLERSDDALLSVSLTRPDRIQILLRQGRKWPANAKVRVEPGVPVVSSEVHPASPDRLRYGVEKSDGWLTFVFCPASVGMESGTFSRVSVAGSFNQWQSGGGNGAWALTDPDRDGVWELTVPASMVEGTTKDHPQFRFAVDEYLWPDPPEGTPNLRPAADGEMNWVVAGDVPEAGRVEVSLSRPLPFDRNYHIAVEGLSAWPAVSMISPLPCLDRTQCLKPLGPDLDLKTGVTTFRLFAPRARKVWLDFYDGPEHTAVENGVVRRVPPKESVAMRPLLDEGAWEQVRPRFETGRWYSFRVDGPEDAGEEVDPERPIGDPYGRSTASPGGNMRVEDPRSTNEWFKGWTDSDFRAAPPMEAVVYEAGLADLTLDPSSKVSEPSRGKYAGLLETIGQGTGLDHLRDLGVTHVVFQPVTEFDRRPESGATAYTPAFFFAPSSVWACAPEKGSAYSEFRRVVNELHRLGIGVVLDLALNNAGPGNPLRAVDRKYFFRSGPDGIGDGTRTEAPMMRRLILENLRFWIRDFHVDGFRLSGSEQIDSETMRTMATVARSEKADMLLIADTRSVRSDQPRDLASTDWSCWNESFGSQVRDFSRMRGRRSQIMDLVMGSPQRGTLRPCQSVNSLGTRGGPSVAKFAAGDGDPSGSDLSGEAMARNRIAATILLTSLGIPLIREGQEFAMGHPEKPGPGDGTGDPVRWQDREREGAADLLAYYKGLIRMRRSPVGACLSPEKRPEEGYIRFAEPDSPHALGYIINANLNGRQCSIAVFVNAGRKAVDFNTLLPAARWKVVGRGKDLNIGGLPDQPNLRPGPYQVRLEPLDSLILLGDPDLYKRQDAVGENLGL